MAADADEGRYRMHAVDGFDDCCMDCVRGFAGFHAVDEEILRMPDCEEVVAAVSARATAAIATVSAWPQLANARIIQNEPRQRLLQWIWSVDNEHFLRVVLLLEKFGATSHESGYKIMFANGADFIFGALAGAHPDVACPEFSFGNSDGSTDGSLLDDMDVLSPPVVDAEGWRDYSECGLTPSHALTALSHRVHQWVFNQVH